MGERGASIKVMETKDGKRDEQRLQMDREDLVERISRAMPEDGSLEVFPGFFLARSSARMESMSSLHQPAFCFVAQGRKRALLGDEVFVYDPGNYLIYTVDLPLTFQVDEASSEKPYLGLRLDLDPTLVAAVVMESGIKIKNAPSTEKAMDVGPVDADMLGAVLRLVRLVEKPENGRILAPLIIREVIYRLLISGQGGRLGHMLASEGDTRRISKAIGHLRQNLDQPLRIDDIARQLGMSVSGFHHHFKSVTAMSPLQFQKQIRLQEARRLMLGEDLDAASAGFRVGYDDPSYFSRDYKKQFGAPPQRDIANLRGTLAA